MWTLVNYWRFVLGWPGPLSLRKKSYNRSHLYLLTPFREEKSLSSLRLVGRVATPDKGINTHLGSARDKNQYLT